MEIKICKGADVVNESKKGGNSILMLCHIALVSKGYSRLNFELKDVYSEMQGWRYLWHFTGCLDFVSYGNRGSHCIWLELFIYVV